MISDPHKDVRDTVRKAVSCSVQRLHPAQSQILRETEMDIFPTCDIWEYLLLCRPCRFLQEVQNLAMEWLDAADCTRLVALLPEVARPAGMWTTSFIRLCPVVRSSKTK